MRLTLIFIFLSQLSFAQVVIAVQKERCVKDSKSITITEINHSKKAFGDLKLIQYSGDNRVELRSVADYRLIWMPIDTGTYGFTVDEKEVPIIFTKLDSLNHFTLDSGCMYSANVLNQADTPYYWYVGNSFVLPIYFDLGNSDLRPDAIPVVDDLVKTLVKYPNISIEVAHHADERSPKWMSTCTTCRRAESIVAYLVEKGIAQERLIAKGYQGDKPFLKGAKTEDEHQMNRRTVITITAVH